MDSHLVTVEVGVECRTHQRMQLNGLTFNQHWLESLNTQSMQRRGAVQHDRMLTDHFFENVPDLGALTLHQLLGCLDCSCQTTQLELAKDEWLEQLERHFLRQTTLMQTQSRANHDHRTTGVVHAFAEQVLAESTLLAFDHVSQRLQRALVGTGDSATTTTIVEQCVNGFLQHALLVSNDDVRCIEIQQTLQAIVAVDDTSIQVVQIRRGEPTAIQRHQRAQLRGQHRQDFEHHPLGPVARLQERLHELETL